MTFRFAKPVLLVVLSFSPSVAWAQGGGMGGFGGGAAGSSRYQNQPTFQNSYANSSEFISVTASAEISVPPESLRLVFAVTAESESSNECANKVKATIAAIRKGLPKLNVKATDAVEDFISVMPSYSWEVKTREEVNYLQEYKTGYRMQTNLHVLCNTEQQANSVIELAFANGVTDIISFDYWHSKLDNFKQEAMEQALEAAKAKSKILLSVFPDSPAVLNIDDNTQVSTPQSLYRTLEAPPTNSEVVLPYDWRDYLKIAAHRPVTTYYAGGNDFSNVTTPRPPMNPEILVRSQITLTYESPARKQRMELERMALQKEQQQSNDEDSAVGLPPLSGEG